MHGLTVDEYESLDDDKKQQLLQILLGEEH